MSSSRSRVDPGSTQSPPKRVLDSVLAASKIHDEAERLAVSAYRPRMGRSLGRIEGITREAGAALRVRNAVMLQEGSTDGVGMQGERCLGTVR